jgi:hypothetical protein
MIKIQKLYPRRFAISWNKDTRVLLIGLYFIVIGIDLGMKKSDWYNHFFRRCPVCGNQLRVNNRNQLVYFHKECRTEGRKMLREGKLKIQNGIAKKVV